MSALANRSARLARIVHLASLVILALATGAALIGGGDAEGPDPFFGVLAIVLIAGYTTLGRLIVTRAGNPIGWVFLAIGSASALSLPAEGYLLSSYQTPYVATLPGTPIAGWIANLAPGLGALAIPMLFLLFPTGAPPTRRWRWVAWLWLAGAVLSAAWLMFRPGEIYGESGRFSIDNPLGLPFVQSLRFLLFDIGTTCVLAAAVASIVSIVARFRRSRGEERQQIKWLMFVAVAALDALRLDGGPDGVHPGGGARRVRGRHPLGSPAGRSRGGHPGRDRPRDLSVPAL